MKLNALSFYLFWYTRSQLLSDSAVLAADTSSINIEEPGPGECDAANGDQTCNAATSTRDSNSSTVDLSHLKDKNTECKFWAESGECDVNPRYMRKTCIKSCTEYDIRHGKTSKANTGPKRSDTCQLYMARSAIPNSGLGMFTAAPIESGEVVYHPDIIVNYFDFAYHEDMISNAAKMNESQKHQEIIGKKRDQNRNCSGWAKEGECDENPSYMTTQCAKSCALVTAGLLKKEKDENEEETDDDEGDDGAFFLPDDYYWDAGNTLSKYEADEVSSLVPGLGALANSHTGLVNCDMDAPSIDSVGNHRANNPGVGAFSTHHNLGFVAKHDIPAGMELFVEYGDEWFSGREYKFGPLPLSNHFEEADAIVEKFWKNFKDDDPLAEGIYQLTLDLINDVKLKMAMPDNLEKAKEARHYGNGVAMLTVPEAVKSNEWLEEHGVCLDNIRADQSTIHEAGRGAFATRNLSKGEVIAPLPMIHLHRDKLQMFNENEENISNDERLKKHQLVLNYCYGHKDSSLLMFPYSPVVNFVNTHQDKEKINAELRWSTSGFNKGWENKTASDIFQSEKYAGLVLEFVALRDIEEDEEIFIDYGKDWDVSWQKHIDNWEPVKDSESFIPIHRMSTGAVILTDVEQRRDPYPPNIEIVCFLHRNIFEETVEGYTQFEYDDYFVEVDNQNDSKPCKIVNRSTNDDDEIVYRISVARNEGGRPFFVNNVPQEAIQMVNRPYSSDQHIENGFRHEIYIPDAIFPEKWRDLKVVDGDDAVNVAALIGDDDNTNGELEDNDEIPFTSTFSHLEVEEGEYDTCRYFIAESSIPNAGIGMYAGVDLKPGDYTKKELAISTCDYKYHAKLRCSYDPSSCQGDADDTASWILEGYEWSSAIARGTYDCDQLYLQVPGMGALPNHHEGLDSAEIETPKKAGAYLHRSKDPGAGAVTLYDESSFQITRGVPAGREIFISYGQYYYEGNSDVPRQGDYEEADTILRKFNELDATKADDDDLQKEWSRLRSELGLSTTILSLIPETLEDVRRAANIGSALNSVPTAQRSLAWLYENGRCLDEIALGNSTIPGAGRGAIARRAIKKGEFVSASPMLQLDRKSMDLFEEYEEDGSIYHEGQQLLLNYCYGHKNSSLLLYPVAPVVSAINHNSVENANTKIQWSTLSNHQMAWMQKSPKDILTIQKSGLFVDFIATRDIQEGEEFFINYGAEWEDAWTNHVENWQPIEDATNYKASWHFNTVKDVIKTHQEEPYPENILILCTIPQDGWIDYAEVVNSPFGKAMIWSYEDDNIFFDAFENASPCTILDRETSPGDSGVEDYYTARIESHDDVHGQVVTRIPRQFIFFADKPYTVDEFLPNAFRHEIMVPDDFYPHLWMDL